MFVGDGEQTPSPHGGCVYEDGIMEYNPLEKNWKFLLKSYVHFPPIWTCLPVLVKAL